MMKKLLLLILTFGLSISMVGCKTAYSSNDDNSNEVIQILADKSSVAKEYATTAFKEYMVSQSIDDYKIEHTSYGFSTSDISEAMYMVAFRYLVADETHQYGYKIIVDDNDICTIIDEGREIADFLLGKNWKSQFIQTVSRTTNGSANCFLLRKNRDFLGQGFSLFQRVRRIKP